MQYYIDSRAHMARHAVFVLQVMYSCIKSSKIQQGMQKLFPILSTHQSTHCRYAQLAHTQMAYTSAKIRWNKFAIMLHTRDTRNFPHSHIFFYNEKRKNKYRAFWNSGVPIYMHCIFFLLCTWLISFYILNKRPQMRSKTICEMKLCTFAEQCWIFVEHVALRRRMQLCSIIQKKIDFNIDIALERTLPHD